MLWRSGALLQRKVSRCLNPLTLHGKVDWKLEVVQMEEGEQLVDGHVRVDELEEAKDLIIPETDKRRKGENARTSTLGENPQEVPPSFRADLQEGSCLFVAGSSSSKTLHRFGSCYMLLGVGYTRLRLRKVDHDVFCKWCSKSGRIDSFSGSNTSSSTSSDDQGCTHRSHLRGILTQLRRTQSEA